MRGGIKILDEVEQYQYAKSRAPHKPLSDCLDHLRSKNGFPTGDHLDLDSFLYPNDTNANNSVVVRPDNPTRTRSPGPAPMTLSALLAQLFNAAAAAHAPPKPPRKYRRKQAHPQIFIRPPSPSTSTTTTATEPPTVVPAANIAVVVDNEENEENDGDDDELQGFSKSEVTVIDTSSPGWKGDKLVFRKDGVWKLREKKPKSRASSNKKSDDTACGTSEDNEINLTGEKPVKTHKII